MSEQAEHIPMERRGHDGVWLEAGWSTIESNPKLSPREWFGSYGRPGVVDEIVRTDMAAQVGVAGLTLNLTATKRTFLPASDREKHRVHAAFLDSVMRRKTTWLVTQLARSAWGGMATQEWWYDSEPKYQFKFGDRGLTKRALLPQFGPIMPWAIDRFRPDGGMVLLPEGGDDARWNDAVELGPDDFIHVRHMPLGDDPSPYGMLRATHPAYLIRRKILRSLGIGVERTAVGTPYFKESKDSQLTPEQKSKARNLLANLRTGAKAHAWIPDTLELLFAEFPFKAKELLEVYESFGRQMLQAMFMQAVEGGITGIGSYASMSGHLALSTSLVTSIDENISNCLEPVWERIIRDNFDDHEGVFPIWHHPEFTIQPDLKEWADAAEKLATAGLFGEVTAADHEQFRSKAHLGPGTGRPYTPLVPSPATIEPDGAEPPVHSDDDDAAA